VAFDLLDRVLLADDGGVVRCDGIIVRDRESVVVMLVHLWSRPISYSLPINKVMKSLQTNSSGKKRQLSILFGASKACRTEIKRQMSILFGPVVAAVCFKQNAVS